LPTNSSVTALAIDPTPRTTLYAGTYAGTVGAVYKSTDGAGSWQAVNAGLPGAPLVSALAIIPTTPSTLYTGTDDDGVFRSTDGASSWRATGLEGGTICGDGVACRFASPPEECDDGNTVNGDGCEANCTASRCGNGIVDIGEE